MEVLKEGLEVYEAQPFGPIGCPECCVLAGDFCDGHNCLLIGP
ncbi:MAG: hypothetical protein RR904_05890 [Bacilli bacterium]